MGNRTLLLGAPILLFLAASLSGQSLKVLTSNGVKAATEILFSKNVVAQYDTTVSLRKKIEAGEPFDVAILTVEAIDGLIQEGTILPSSRRDFARAGVGVGYQKGAKKPDLSSAEAFRQSLLDAKSITYNEAGASRQAIEKALSRLGIADAIKAKAIIETESGRPQMDVGEGKVELVLTLVPEIPIYENVELAGPFPQSLQTYTSFAIGISKDSKNFAKAAKLIEFLISPTHATMLKAKGLQPK